ncbi:MAG: PTS lactose/cellobiose transporter subunit IIA [Solobacterium sp.]|nr:PTS lactose/cellobiose transporter subunit IIA [Solobacterium sp.]MBR3343624.1 PTS lactose/cellobiose transporter subunit IIA [Solobacterium sp.]
MEGIELVAFNIIASVGTARSCYIGAIDAAAEGKFDEARQMIKDGQEAFVLGHDAHMGLLTKMANGETVETNLLMLHAEDQLMSAEGFGILAERFITLYEKVLAK